MAGSVGRRRLARAGGWMLEQGALAWGKNNGHDGLGSFGNKRLRLLRLCSDANA
jgi:hypothetical protein